MKAQLMVPLLVLSAIGCNSADKRSGAEERVLVSGLIASEEQRYLTARAVAAKGVPSPSSYGSHMLVPVNFGMSRARVRLVLAEWAKIDPKYKTQYNLDGHQLRSEYISAFENDQLVRCGLRLLLDSLNSSQKQTKYLYQHLQRDIGAQYAFATDYEPRLGESIMEQGYPHGDTLHAARSWFWGATEIEVQRLPRVGYQILYENLSNRQPTQQEILADSLKLKRAAEVF